MLTFDLSGGRDESLGSIFRRRSQHSSLGNIWLFWEPRRYQGNYDYTITYSPLIMATKTEFFKKYS